MAVITCIAIYFFGKDIGGKEVGLFSAFFLALNASYIGRTSLGFFDDETIGVFGIIIFSLFFLRAIEQEKPMRNSVLYALAAGLSLGYVYASWGASRYPAGLALVFVAVMLLLRRYSTRLLISYAATFGVALLIAAGVPKLGFNFMLETTNLIIFGMFLILCAFEIERHIKTTRMKSLFALSFIVLAVGLFFALNYFGYAHALQGKYISVLNPFERLYSPVVSSVQEHRPASWGSIYYDLGIGILFIPVGFYFAAQNPTNRNVYLVLFGLTGIYFASSMVRLMLILAPALSILWALALTRVLKPFITLLREASGTIRRKARLESRVGREFSAAFLILMFLLLTFTFIFPSTESRIRGDPFPRVLEQAYVPTTIASASLPIKPDQTIPDWIDALDWMRYNLPSDAVVVAWWDYGYWITTIGNKTTLIDNATLNTTQIGRVGEMFLSPEPRALEILNEFNQKGLRQGFPSISNKTYVVAFFTFYGEGVSGVTAGTDIGYGEESKWKWMANIAFDDLNIWKTYGNYTLGKDGIDTDGDGRPDQTVDNINGQNTVLYELMMFGKLQRISSLQPTPEPPEHFDLVYWSQKGQSSAVTAGGINALVTVWKVDF
jgi:dolichyl-diphosphooligosaccharide--protein glycosyltransferase